MSAVDVIRRRISGSYVVDESGLDPDVARIVAAVLGFGWRIHIEGADRLPDGAALLVHNRLFGPAETFAVARGLGLAAGRWVRFVGVPDVEPLATVLRKLGGVSGHPAEVAGLLRSGHLVAVGQRRSLRRRPSPHVPEGLASIAAGLSVAVVPVSVVGTGPGSWRVTVL